jgi:hypothetical protein
MREGLYVEPKGHTKYRDDDGVDDMTSAPAVVRAFPSFSFVVPGPIARRLRGCRAGVLEIDHLCSFVAVDT